MNTDLRTMLHDAADAHPPYELTDDPWQRGRRIRRRRRVAGAGVVAAAVLVAIGVAVVDLPDVSPQPVPPAVETPGEPTLPDRLYDVSPTVPDVTDDPLGGPASVVYFGPKIRTGISSTSTAVPVLVGATNDAIRTVHGYSEVSGRARTALSPDGTMLAITPEWSLHLDGGPTVAVIDVVSGETRTFVAPDAGLGGGVSTLTWSVDGTSLAVTTVVTTDRFHDEMGGGAEGEEQHLTLDLDSGEWIERQHLAALAFSPDGQRELRWDDEYQHLVVAEVDGPLTAQLDRGSAWAEPSAAFSPDGNRLAVLEADTEAGVFNPPMPFELVLYHAASGTQRRSIGLGDYEHAEILGWGERGVVVALYDWSATMVWRIDPADGTWQTLIRTDGQGTQGIGIPAGLVDADVRAVEPPPRQFDWVGLFGLLPWVFGAALIALVVWAYRLRRSRRALAGDLPHQTVRPMGREDVS